MASEQAKCELCGEPMPPGEEMFKFHGYSGPCPKPPTTILPPMALCLDDKEPPLVPCDPRVAAELKRRTESHLETKRNVTRLTARVAALEDENARLHASKERLHLHADKLEDGIREAVTRLSLIQDARDDSDASLCWTIDRLAALLKPEEKQ